MRYVVLIVLMLVVACDIAELGAYDVQTDGVLGVSRINHPAHHLADALRAEGIDFRAFGVNSQEDLLKGKKLKISGFTTNKWRAAFDWANAVGGVNLLK